MFNVCLMNVSSRLCLSLQHSLLRSENNNGPCLVVKKLRIFKILRNQFKQPDKYILLKYLSLRGQRSQLRAPRSGLLAAVVHVWPLGPGHAALLAVVSSEDVTLPVQPALALVTAGVAPEPALWVVLAEALAVRRLGDVLHVQDLVLVPVAGLAVPELVLTRQMELSVITVVCKRDT